MIYIDEQLYTKTAIAGCYDYATNLENYNRFTYTIHCFLQPGSNTPLFSDVFGNLTTVSLLLIIPNIAQTITQIHISSACFKSNSHTHKRNHLVFFLARQNVHCFLRFCSNLFSFNHSVFLFVHLPSTHMIPAIKHLLFYQQQEWWCRKTSQASSDVWLTVEIPPQCFFGYTDGFGSFLW